MRKPLLRLYAPFIAIALVQALFVLLAPSTGGKQQLSAAGPLAADSGAAGTTAAGDAGATGDQSAAGGATTPGAGATGATPGVATGGGSTGGATSGGTAARTGGATTAGGTAAAGATTGAAQGDTSHCVNGMQQGITFYSPPCAPKFTGDNKGATAQGVSAKEIKVVYFRETPNEQVSAILRPVGLADNTADINAFMDAAVDFLNKRYELYGRKIVLTKVLAPCPQTPPDIPKCRDAARQVAATKPFAVVWNTPLYSGVFDEFVRAGIVTVGGWNMDQSVFTGRRPYRWDTLMDGTKAATAIGDYFCKKLAGKNADHSGAVIHPSIGARGQVRRKLGIVTPDDPANIASANALMNYVNKCSPGSAVKPYTYQSDINRAQEQTNATVAGLIQNKITTVACMCDPIAPVFLTKGMTTQNYFPEYLNTGTQFSDYDLVGRLYDPQQMAHNFGPSQLQNFLPFDQQDQSKVWHDVGRSGTEPCQTCGTNWAEMSLLGSMLEMAGPNLSAATIERGMFSLKPRGGDPFHQLVSFGPNDYTGFDDVREVYWDATAISQVDSKPGAFVPIDGGKRTPVGRFGPEFKVPAPKS